MVNVKLESKQSKNQVLLRAKPEKSIQQCFIAPLKRKP